MASKDLSMGVPQSRDDDGSLVSLQKVLLSSAELISTDHLAKVRRRPNLCNTATNTMSGIFTAHDINPTYFVQDKAKSDKLPTPRVPLMATIPVADNSSSDADVGSMAMTTKVSKSGRPLRTPRHLPPVDDSNTAMKRTRSARSEAAGKPVSSKKKKGRGVGDIKSPTSRTLLRMLRVGTGQTTANNTSKSEAEKHIRRLAGEFVPKVALAKRYAGREALQELLSLYLGKPISFQEAVSCFENPHNRGLQATQALTDLLEGRSWPPYPENAGLPLNASEDDNQPNIVKSESMEVAQSRELPVASPVESSPMAKLSTPDNEPEHSENSLGQVITTGSWTDTECSSGPCSGPVVAPFSSPAVVPSILDDLRPVVTTGFSKAGTAFQTELDLASYNRRSGAHNATLELRSLQLLSHNIDPPAALVTIRRHRTDDPPLSPSEQDKPISLTSLRLSTILGIKPPSVTLPSASGLALRG